MNTSLYGYRLSLTFLLTLTFDLGCQTIWTIAPWLLSFFNDLNNSALIYKCFNVDREKRIKLEPVDCSGDQADPKGMTTRQGHAYVVNVDDVNRKHSKTGI